MRIVSVGPAPPWRGGIAHYHFALVEQLKSDGVEVEVLNFSRLYPRFLFPGTTPSDLSESALPSLGEQIVRPLWPPSWRKGGVWINNRDPEAVLFHFWHPFFAPAYLGLLKRLDSDRRIGFICHNVDSHEKMPLGTMLTARVLKRADFLITGGGEMAARLRQLNRRAVTEVILHPRYDLPHTREAPERDQARKSLGIEEDAAVFLFFGIVREYKGLDTLYNALAMLPADQKWTCIVAGEFYGSRTSYDATIKTLGLQERVRVEDRYIPNSEVPDYFAAADVTVLPYRHATQSGVAALSFAFNRPVVTTRVGALPEMITEGENGWILPPDDPEALASLLSQIVGNRQMAHLPVLKGHSSLPTWSDLSRAVRRLAGGEGSV